MGRGRSESGEAEDELEQLTHSLNGNSVSLLPQDQDLKDAEGFEATGFRRDQKFPGGR